MTTDPPTRSDRGSGSPLLRLALALGLLVACVACGGGRPHDRVTVMVPWTQKSEFQAFYSLVENFEDDTGVHVDVQVTRALTQQLDAAVEAGSPPDLAVLPSVGAISTYAGPQRRSGLKELDADDLDTFVEPFRGLARGRDGKTYAVPVKVDVKSLVWHDPAATGKPPTGTTAALGVFTRSSALTWCLGLASGPTSGWPGADWIADILLADAGADTYTRWLTDASGREWRSAEVEQSWARWHRLVGDTALKTAATKDFAEATEAMAAGRHTCDLAHGARSALDSDLRAGGRLGFAAPQDHNPVEVSGDFMGMFTDRNANARAFMKYLAGHEAQQAWAKDPQSAAFSARSDVTYADPTQRGIAAILHPGSGHALCFSAADLMTPDVAAAFYRAVLDYADGAKGLHTLLASLAAVQQSLRASPVPADSICSQPS